MKSNGKQVIELRRQLIANIVAAKINELGGRKESGVNGDEVVSCLVPELEKIGASCTDEKCDKWALQVGRLIEKMGLNGKWGKVPEHLIRHYENFNGWSRLKAEKYAIKELRKERKQAVAKLVNQIIEDEDLSSALKDKVLVDVYLAHRMYMIIEKLELELTWASKCLNVSWGSKMDEGEAYEHLVFMVLKRGWGELEVALDGQTAIYVREAFAYALNDCLSLDKYSRIKDQYIKRFQFSFGGGRLADMEEFCDDVVELWLAKLQIAYEAIIDGKDPDTQHEELIDREAPATKIALTKQGAEEYQEMTMWLRKLWRIRVNRGGESGFDFVRFLIQEQIKTAFKEEKSVVVESLKSFQDFITEFSGEGAAVNLRAADSELAGKKAAASAASGGGAKATRIVLRKQIEMEHSDLIELLKNVCGVCIGDRAREPEYVATWTEKLGRAALKEGKSIEAKAMEVLKDTLAARASGGAAVDLRAADSELAGKKAAASAASGKKVRFTDVAPEEKRLEVKAAEMLTGVDASASGGAAADGPSDALELAGKGLSTEQGEEI